MPSTDEDRRAAVALSTNLSGQLVQAAVAMLTVEGAYIAYALVARDTSGHFNTVAFLSALFFVVSIFLSGKGITQARNAGFDGNWSLAAGKKFFNLQAIVLLIALTFFGWMLFLSGSPKESDTQLMLSKINAEMARIKLDSERQREQLAEELDKLKSENRQLQERVAEVVRSKGGASAPTARSAP